jgi:hypothetical protein
MSQAGVDIKQGIAMWAMAIFEGTEGELSRIAN